MGELMSATLASPRRNAPDAPDANRGFATLATPLRHLKPQPVANPYFTGICGTATLATPPYWVAQRDARSAATLGEVTQKDHRTLFLRITRAARGAD